MWQGIDGGGEGKDINMRSFLEEKCTKLGNLGEIGGRLWLYLRRRRGRAGFFTLVEIVVFAGHFRSWLLFVVGIFQEGQDLSTYLENTVYWWKRGGDGDFSNNRNHSKRTFRDPGFSKWPRNEGRSL